ncbi:glycosyltransferase [Cohnella soli]|uniref:Glycosyltransferase n=1 Tax=Cohnella soli TaxID=425005 RepID=A0ABW0I2S5_9BACL
MKTKVLFVMSNLTSGGAEKSLLSVLQAMDYTRYEVDLFLFKHEGLFFGSVPSQVNVLPAPPLYPLFDTAIGKGIAGLLKRGKPHLALHRVRLGYIHRTETRPAVREQRAWRHLSPMLPKLVRDYDVAIGYLENNPVRFVVDRVRAKIKIGYIHNDYDKLGMDPVLDDAYFAKLDSLVTVSEECGNVLRNRFPAYQDKVRVIHNLVSPDVIRAMADNPVEWETSKAFRIVTVGRLHPQKGYDMALEACKLLADEGLDIQWYVIGEGEERNNLEREIERLELQDRFKLLGVQENPYPYVGQADLYVQPSRFEGKSIAIDEAKILHKPIVVTRFTTAGDQIRTEENGLIVEMNAKSLGEGIKRLLRDEPLRLRFAGNLAQEELSTESEINKLYELFKS